MSEYNCPKCEYSSTWMGITIHHSKKHGEKLDASDYIKDDISRVEGELGKVPTRREYNEYGDFSAKSCDKHFGSWNNAIRECGFNTYQTYDYDKEDLIEELKRLKDKFGRAPYYQEMKEHSKYSVKPYKNLFDTWNNALDKAGLDINKGYNIDNEKLLDELKRLNGELGRAPYAYEMYEFGKYGSSTYIKTFGKWNDALKEAGLEVNVKSIVIDEEYKDRRKLEEWKKSVKDRDSYKCQDCGSENSLHSHHIKRRAEYPDLMFDVDNGITLCASCHAERHKNDRCYEMLKAKALNSDSPNIDS